MKTKTYIIFLILLFVSIINLKFNYNIFYPYYLLKDLIYLPVLAIESDVGMDTNVLNGLLIEKEKEVQELKNLNNLSNTLSEFDKISAMVVERNKLYWFNSLTINKGSSDGLIVDSAVITGSGLIGRITKCSLHTAEVKLITTNDTYHKISVMIDNNGNTIYGILSGYNSNENTLEVTSVNKNTDIQLNSKVYTSGMGGVFPSGIIIGEVVNTIADKYDVSKLIQVKPSASINDTRFVNVLIRK